MKALYVSMIAAAFGACCAVLVRKDKDLSKQVYIQDDYGNLKLGYDLDETNGALHSKHPIKGIVDQAYSNGRFQYGAEIRDIPYNNQWQYGHLPVTNRAGQINWLVSSSHQVHRDVPSYIHGTVQPYMKYRHPDLPEPYPYVH